VLCIGEYSSTKNAGITLRVPVIWDEFRRCDYLLVEWESSNHPKSRSYSISYSGSYHKRQISNPQTTAKFQIRQRHNQPNLTLSNLTFVFGGFDYWHSWVLAGTVLKFGVCGRRSSTLLFESNDNVTIRKSPYWMIVFDYHW